MSIKLIYGSSQHDADVFYWSRLFICDPFLAFEVDGRRTAISNSLEIDEMRRNSGFDEILLPEDLTGKKHSSIVDLIQCICEKFSRHDLVLHENFPAFLVQELLDRNIKFSICKGEFSPERLKKSSSEIAHIRKACSVIANAYEQVRSILAASEIVDGFLYYNGQVLTSEFMRSEIRKICFLGGAIANETIVSCGKDSAFPHNRGRGKLRPNEFIVVDIFPRLIESGYYGDMTRTFLKGEPSKIQKKMYDAVMEVQKQAISEICTGKNAKEIYQNSVAKFEKLGYQSTDSAGFFHSMGHGVGLSLHESPSIGACDHVLQRGEVVTVEPGLYYFDIGGVRIEDVVIVEDGGAELLSNFSYEWVI